jgi:CDP-glycerol glycerophosphotransferase (TagB/SpsB family)
MTNPQRTIFISADHGLAIIYFLQSDLVKTLLEKGARVVVLTDDGLVDQIKERFGMPGMIVEGLRFKACQKYANEVSPSLQYWSNFIRRVGTSKRINTEAMDSHIKQVETEAQGITRLRVLVAKGFIAAMRNFKAARQGLVKWQMRFTPNIYDDLFEKYKPDLVVSATYGWRNDRYLLRESVRRGIKTGAVIVGWDNPSSYGIPAAPLDFVTCWSEIQKQELVDGSDWDPSKVNIGGIPSYDGYFRKEWLIPCDEYYKLHKLEKDRKLITYASSFITFAPNYLNIEALAKLVAADELSVPSQLLIRLHPNHFMDEPLYIEEREKVRELAHTLPHVHVVEPVALGGDLGYYSGEDMPEKTSMMAYSDVFTTVYSTMCVETAIHGRPIVSICIDTPGGWNKKHKFSLKLSKIGDWPTHQRFRMAGAGRVAYNAAQLKENLNLYLSDPNLDATQREKFIKDEVTFTDGSAGRRTAEYLYSLL